MAATYSFESLTGDAKVRYEQKLSAIGLHQCPYLSPADLWVDDPTEWPPVEFGDLFMYLTSTPGKNFGFMIFKLF